MHIQRFIKQHRSWYKWWIAGGVWVENWGSTIRLWFTGLYIYSSGLIPNGKLSGEGKILQLRVTLFYTGHNMWSTANRTQDAVFKSPMQVQFRFT